VLFILVILVLLNGYGFGLVAWDKNKARHHEWRVPEKRFFIISALGGAIGVYGGCLYFRHKTQHPSFMYGIPAIFVVELFILFLIPRIF